MKIAYLSFLAPPGQPAVSGVPKVSETLLREFETLPGLEVEVVTLVDGLEQETIQVQGQVRYHYLPCRPHGKTFTFYWFERRRLLRYLSRLEVDLVHGQPTSEYLMATTGSGRPHVITIHGLVLRETAGQRRWSGEYLANSIREYYQRQALRRAANVISISPYVDEYVQGWTRGKLWPVANPIDPEFFDVPAPERQGLRMVCVGLVSTRKNQARLVEACGLLSHQNIKFECRLVGPIQPTEGQRIRDLIQQSGLNGKVTLMGGVSKQCLLEQYAWSNVVVLPSREETSPLSLIQGLANGRCAFGGDAAGIPHLLQHGKLGTLFPTEDAPALASALGSFATNGDAFWNKAKLGQEHARATYRPQAVAQRTKEVYEQVLKTQHAP
jgi:glycosyltransferase involved in cell wall biosynthesis